MDIQYYGANCLVINHKSTRIVVDDNLAGLGSKSIVKAEDVALYTTIIAINSSLRPSSRIIFDGPGEYEVGDISIIGIAAKPFMNDNLGSTATIYKLVSADQNILICGHISEDLSERQLEQIGTVDILFVPVGNNGYTLDPKGALKLIKDIEPKIIVPTHYSQQGINYPIPQISLEEVTKELAIEVKDRTNKLKIKTSELSDSTQLIVLEKI